MHEPDELDVHVLSERVLLSYILLELAKGYLEETVRIHVAFFFLGDTLCIYVAVVVASVDDVILVNDGVKRLSRWCRTVVVFLPLLG